MFAGPRRDWLLGLVAADFTLRSGGGVGRAGVKSDYVQA